MRKITYVIQREDGKFWADDDFWTDEYPDAQLWIADEDDVEEVDEENLDYDAEAQWDDLVAHTENMASLKFNALVQAGEVDQDAELIRNYGLGDQETILEYTGGKIV